MADVLSFTVPAGVALLLAKDLVRAIQYRNGSSRRLNEDRVRLIVQEETHELAARVAKIGDDVTTLLATQKAQAFRASGGRSG